MTLILRLHDDLVVAGAPRPGRVVGAAGHLEGGARDAVDTAAVTLTAIISLPVNLPTLVFDSPPASAFPPALGLSTMMAVTFGVTTEAMKRGPVGRVSPITRLSSALTAVLAATILDEQLTLTAALGVAAAVRAVVLLGYQPQREPTEGGWLWLAIGSLVLQGVGAFLAKVVVTPSGPSALLVTSAAIQVADSPCFDGSTRRFPMSVRA